MEIKTPVK